ncbi:MAG TPA: DinB family protein [Acidimicrobiales bacterium]|nr:DinB family protein [Acidimicrobiales bacterium]
MKCEECGFVYEDVPGGEIAERLLTFPALVRAALAAIPADRIRQRPEPATWSPLEYTCHLRDAFLAQRERAVVALVEDGPRFTRIYRDERVDLTGYDEDDVDSALAGLDVGATLLARTYRRMTTEQMQRPCDYNLPHAGLVDLTWVGRHSVHEGEHHLLDIRRQS